MFKKACAAEASRRDLSVGELSACIAMMYELVFSLSDGGSGVARDFWRRQRGLHGLSCRNCGQPAHPFDARVQQPFRSGAGEPALHPHVSEVARGGGDGRVDASVSVSADNLSQSRTVSIRAAVCADGGGNSGAREAVELGECGGSGLVKRGLRQMIKSKDGTSPQRVYAGLPLRVTVPERLQR